MLDLFLELDIINEQIETLRNMINNLDLYFNDLLETSFYSSVLKNNEETCLDYMEYGDYNKSVAKELKSIANTIQKETNNTCEKLISLENKRKLYLDVVSRFSKVKYYELIYLFSNFNITLNINGFEWSKRPNIFVEEEGNLAVNPLIANIVDFEILDFIKYYINTKLNNIKGINNVCEIYENYKNEVKNVINLV